MFIQNIKLNDLFVTDVQIKSEFVPQTPNQADKLYQSARIFQKEIHIYIKNKFN